jgi:hypothetical protein
MSFRGSFGCEKTTDDLFRLWSPSDDKSSRWNCPTGLDFEDGDKR